MSDSSNQKAFATLREFLNDRERDEDIYFHFNVVLRIHGLNLPFAEITNHLGVQPTMVRQKGERRGPRSPQYADDAWHFQPDISETELLEKHILALLEVVRPNVEYLKNLKSRFKVDIFCGYRSNCDHAGFDVPYECLELFTLLEVPFGISVIIA